MAGISKERTGQAARRTLLDLGFGDTQRYRTTWSFWVTATVFIISAFVLIVASTAKFTAVGVSAVRSLSNLRRRRETDLQHLRQAAEVARLNSELQAAVGKGNGLDWRVMEVAELVDESEDCRSFYLVDPYGQELPDFRPGQYLMIRPALAGAYQTTRCYSLSSSPNSRFWRITVKRQEAEQPERRLMPSGGLSAWLHRTIRVGDCLLIGGPNGKFYLPKESRRPLVLLAAGVGITPMASMLRWSLENTPDRLVALLYQAKDLEHWPLGPSLHSWQTSFDSCHIMSFFSREDAATLQSVSTQIPGSFFKGKFTASEAFKSLRRTDCDYYMCGPDGWMKAIREGLETEGVPEDQIHWESFGTGVGAQPAAAKSDAASVSVRFEHSQVESMWSDPEQTLWEFARENHVEIPSGCLSGVCGCCRVKLLEGEIEYDREIAIELASDECLTCVSRPKSDVVIDA